jgi:ribonuclease BN (tRNA processing enzyme)
MKLLFLGTGAGLLQRTDNYQSNMLFIAQNNKKLLIDCGTDIRFALAEQKYKYIDIEAVYISHLHADHMGGLEWLGFNYKFKQTGLKPTLYISEHLVTRLWENCLSGSMRALPSNHATLDTYFKVKAIKDDSYFTWENTKFYLIQTFHVTESGVLVPSYGLYIHYKNKKIFITTDTQFQYDRYADIYNEANLIFHDCETTKPSCVHTHYDQLVPLDNSIKKKMWLYHYNENILPDAQKDGFCGFVTKGQIFDLDH